MKKKLYQYTIELTNGPVTSGLLRRFAKSGASSSLIGSYIRAYKIDVKDIEQPLESFLSLHDFFIRQLKPESRQSADTAIVSPVDGRIEVLGDLHENILFSVKQQLYSLENLLGSEKLASAYSNGKYIVLYLSPADYHRIHSPSDGKVIRQYVLGRKSYPVNQSGLLFGKSPISGNHRLITELETDFGRMLVVKVGAMFVNSIELTNTGELWKKGEEVGHFSFGSTVVLFFQDNSIEFCEKAATGEQIKVGEALANVL